LDWDLKFYALKLLLDFSEMANFKKKVATDYGLMNNSILMK